MLNNNVSSTVNRKALRLLNMSSLQDRIGLALSRARINASTLAKRAKVSRGTVSLWVNGPTQMIEGDNLTRAATVLGVDSHWLATGEGIPYSDESLRAEQPSPTYEAARSATVSELLEALRKDINPLPEIVRNCVFRLMESYLSDHNQETRAEAAEAIERLLAR